MRGALLSSRETYIVLGILAAVLLQGCAIATSVTGPVPLVPPFWEAPPRSLGVVLHEAPEGGIYRSGGDDLYHEVVSDSRDKELIRIINASAPLFDWLAEEFATMMAERSFAVRRLPADCCGLDSGSVVAPLLEFPVASEEVELLLVITPEWWGIHRDYAGVFPVGSHKAAFEIRVELFDIPNRLLLWSGVASRDVSLDRRWNEPPDHPKVYAALEAALNKAGASAVEALRNWDGKQAELGFRIPAASEMNAAAPPEENGQP
jgi:hypothetical protein